MDGIGRVTRIRQAHLHHVHAYILARTNDMNDLFRQIATDRYRDIIHLLQLEHDKRQNNEPADFFNHFVNFTKKKPDIVVFSQITPDNPHYFFIHLLLTMGRFSRQYVTEVDLYSQNTLLEAFRAVGLLQADNPSQ